MINKLKFFYEKETCLKIIDQMKTKQNKKKIMKEKSV